MSSSCSSIYEVSSGYNIVSQVWSQVTEQCVHGRIITGIPKQSSVCIQVCSYM